MDKKKRFARVINDALRRFAAEEPITPFRKEGWLAETAKRLGGDHPLSGIFQTAADEGTKVYGRVVPMRHRSDEEVKAESHDLGDGVTAAVRRYPLPESKGYENVHVTLHHKPSGRTGEFSVHQRV